jgi:Fe-S cluster assembly protein SufD
MSIINTNYLAPTGREEAWRFTPIKKIAPLLDSNAALQEQISFRLKSEVSGVTLENSEIAAASANLDEAVTKLRTDVKRGQILSIAKNFEGQAEIRLIRSFNSSAPSGSRLQVIVGENAHAKLILDNTGDVLLSDEIEFILQQGATLDFISLQEWGADSVHLGRQHAILAKDSTFNSILITLGGEVIRILPTIEFTGPGAFANLFGLYFATDGQHLEHRLHVDHNLGHAKSRVNYKGALSGSLSRTVWIGDVYIRANAEGTDTYELNRNLLLSDGARADSVPNLEIETGEIVGAGHASTTGKFDDEQLFYLMSRGIPMNEARQLVIRGFFNEIVNLIKNDEIEERLMNRIDTQLSKVGSI